MGGLVIPKGPSSSTNLHPKGPSSSRGGGGKQKLERKQGVTESMNEGWGLGSRILSSGFGVQGLGFRAYLQKFDTPPRRLARTAELSSFLLALSCQQKEG